MSEEYYKNRCIELDKKLDRVIDSHTKLEDKIKYLETNWKELKKWLEDENNQQYSQYIYNYSINDWVLNKMQEIESKNND